jgi:hypothetical protein
VVILITRESSGFSRNPLRQTGAALRIGLMRVMELHSPVKLVQRSKGRTATAAAAYRSGTRIECERTGETHDYTRKKGIELTSLLFPADAPDWAHDRAALWNAAEKREKHPRAQTARDVEVSFPAEFSPEERREAGLAIGSMIVDRYGVAADLCWHQPSSKGDDRNHHLHILCTTRRFENGDWAKTKDRTLDDLYGKGADEVISLRQGIADTLNNIAARAGLYVYVEHLSFEKRGIDKEATQHVGASATEMERRGVKTDIGNKNREIEGRNKESQKLHEERKALNAEIEQELRPQHKQSTQNIDPHKVFYQETQSRRLALMNGLDQQFGKQERDARQELTQLFNSVSRAKGVASFWRNLTGRSRKEQESISRLRANLENIQQRRAEAFEAFERDRQERLEVLKKERQEGNNALEPKQEISQKAGIKSEQADLPVQSEAEQREQQKRLLIEEMKQSLEDSQTLSHHSEHSL